jgi:hypothetical protein
MIENDIESILRNYLLDKLKDEYPQLKIYAGTSNITAQPKRYIQIKRVGGIGIIDHIFQSNNVAMFFNSKISDGDAERLGAKVHATILQAKERGQIGTVAMYSYDFLTDTSLDNQTNKDYNTYSATIDITTRITN